MLGLINKLATSKLIKTVGDGLTLTSAGTLKANIDTDTMEIVNHKLSSKGGMTVDVLFSQDPGNCPDIITLTAPYTDYKLLVFAIFDTEASDKNYGYGKNIFPTASPFRGGACRNVAANGGPPAGSVQTRQAQRRIAHRRERRKESLRGPRRT